MWPSPDDVLADKEHPAQDPSTRHNKTYGGLKERVCVATMLYRLWVFLGSQRTKSTLGTAQRPTFGLGHCMVQSDQRLQVDETGGSRGCPWDPPSLPVTSESSLKVSFTWKGHVVIYVTGLSCGYGGAMALTYNSSPSIAFNCCGSQLVFPEKGRGRVEMLDLCLFYLETPSGNMPCISPPPRQFK